MQTVIMHIDVDAFFASVEQLLIPRLRGRSVIVGSGCIASCSYEARKLGLRAGMSLSKARQLCPRAVVLKGDYQIYRCFAEAIWDICRQYADTIETFLDEAYADITDYCGWAKSSSPQNIGLAIQQRVGREVGLPVSIGLAANRMLAKIASHAAKPGKVIWIAPERAEDYLADLPIEDIPGIGGKTAERFHDLNIRTVKELRQLPRPSLESMLGQRGLVIYERCRGRDVQKIGSSGIAAPSPQPPAGADANSASPMTPGTIRTMPKTVSRETTFHQPTCDLEEIRGMIFYLLERAMRVVRQAGLLAGTLELHIRYDDFKQLDAARRLPEPTDADGEAFDLALELLEQLYKRRVSLRHVGIVLSNFRRAADKGKLFQPAEQARRAELYKAVDQIRGRFGHAALVAGQSIELVGQLEQNDYGFVLRTPSLTK